ncbi:hypothetical protein [Nonomuraea angiospora]
MDRDQRPANPMQDIRDLQRDVAQAQGSAGKREALTKASKGWHIPNTGIPATPDDGGHLFVNGNKPYWIDKNGIITPLIVPPPTAANVTPLTATSGTASDTINAVGGSYDQTVLNNNFRSLATKLNQILTAMKSRGLMDGP